MGCKKHRWQCKKWNHLRPTWKERLRSGGGEPGDPVHPVLPPSLPWKSLRGMCLIKMFTKWSQRFGPGQVWGRARLGGRTGSGCLRGHFLLRGLRGPRSSLRHRHRGLGRGFWKNLTVAIPNRFQIWTSVGWGLTDPV